MKSLQTILLEQDINRNLRKTIESQISQLEMKYRELNDAYEKLLTEEGMLSCDHSDVCHDEMVCLICGKDMAEDLLSAAYDRAKDFRKYGED